MLSSDDEEEIRIKTSFSVEDRKKQYKHDVCMSNVNFGRYVFVILIYASIVLEIMFKVYKTWDNLCIW